MRLLMLALVAGALTVAGCGGGSHKQPSGASTAPVSSSKGSNAATVASGQTSPTRRFIANADIICNRLSDVLDQPQNSAQAKAEIVRVAAIRGSLEARALNELSKLSPPASLTAAYRQMLAYRQALIVDLAKIGQFASSGKNKDLQHVYESSGATARRMNALAKRSGFRFCGALG
jgi:hypothetical protein